MLKDLRLLPPRHFLSLPKLSFPAFPFPASNMASFPVLYGESSHGKRKMWSVHVEERDGAGVVVQKHGYVDAKIVVNERVISTGKNIGKKNETTPVQQAINEAQALWNKKRDAAYVPDGAAAAPEARAGAGAPPADAEESSDSDSGAAGVILPMLAKDFNKDGKHIKFPCFAQRKLDGVRCVAIPGRGLFSRNGKAFPHMEHVRTEVDRLKDGAGLVAPGTFHFDGELYSDELTFQEIVGLVKKETLKPADAEKMKKIYLCVYDCIITGNSGGYAARERILHDIFEKMDFKNLRLLPSGLCESVEVVKRLHAEYVAEGYEGLILRNMTGAYKLKHRSNDLQKYKEFADAEYPIVGFKEGDGVEKGCVIWICRTAAGQEFAVRPRGTHEDRQEAFRKGDSAVGKQLTVRYQELTNDGIPRFPVGLTIRDYE